MAARFLVAGGTGNWDSTTNWSATSGGASGATAPTVADTVALDSLSGNAPLTVNVSSAALSFIASGTYTGTVTFNAQLAVSGAITLIAGMTLAGIVGPLVPNATGTLTSGGKTIPCPLTFGASATYTLVGNWAVSGLVTAGVTTGTTTINATTAETLTCAGGYHQGGTTAAVTGSAKLTISGGTWDSSSTGATSNNIDLAGNVAVSGAVTWNSVGSRTLTYVSGTITTTGSTLTVSSTSTLATAGVTWNNLTAIGNGITYTLSSNLTGSGTLTIGSTTQTWTGAGTINWTGPVLPQTGTLTLNNTGGLVTTGTMTHPNANVTWTGSAGWAVGTLTTATLSASRTYTLTVGNTYTVTTNLNNVGTTATIRQALVSATPGTKATFKVTPGATEALLYCDPTDIDSSSGAVVVSINGVITTSLNWSGSVTAVSAGAGGSFYHYGRRR
jgi:hypothetical protein